MPQPSGLHHVTAIAGDPALNLEFYTRVLGLRLVKRSVNQDATDTYHLFYADAEGRPGTDLTFFPWPSMQPTRGGSGLAVEVGFAVAPGTLAAWSKRLRQGWVEVTERPTVFGETSIGFTDPHGLALSITESSRTLETVTWEQSPVPATEQLRGFHAVRLCASQLGPTADFLTGVFGFEEQGRDGDWVRFTVGGGGSSRIVDVREDRMSRPGNWGTGAIHHVAFRVDDEESLLAVRERVASAGLNPTDVIDRFWFRSVYFREPGGVLFELATEGPGFTVDENQDALGEKLILPPWLEPRRAEIEAGLPPLDAPSQ